MTRTVSAILVPIVVALSAAAAPAVAQADEAYGDDYRTGNYGRVRHHDGGVTLRRAASDGGPESEDAGQLNSPIFPGDTLITDFGQRAEIQLGGGSIVRVDRGTQLTFLALPDPYATIADNTILQLTDGAVRIDALLSDEEEFRIDTPASSVYLLGDGDFRIEVDEDGFTRVFSRRGVAEVVGQGGSVLVRGGTRGEVYPGSLPREADPFNTFASDSFDRWVENREAAYRDEDRYADDADSYDELPPEVQPYYRELSTHGSWVYTSDYGHVWYPNRVAVGWRPYTDGYWNYGPHGYFWVSHEPWGWAPYRYGRWAWVGGRGWCWIPGRVFAGAWVAWSWGSLYVGWSPLDYWNRPCYVSSLYYSHYDPYAWTFVHYNHFGHRRYHRYAVGVHDVRHRLRDHAVVTRPPRVRPTDLARSDTARSRAARLAHEDRIAALRPDLDDRRQRRNMNDLERTLTPGRGHERVADTRTPADSGRRAPGAKASTPPTRGGLLSDDDRPARRARSTDAPFERRLTQPDSDSGRRRPAGRVARPGDTGREPRSDDTAQDTPRRRTADTPGADRRVRDLYERMSQPRTTRERSSGSAARRSSPAPSREPRARSTTPPARSQPEARPSSPPQRSQPEARPSSPPQRSQPRARPSSPPQRSQPRARPSSPPQRSQPRARPSSPPQRSQPEARPSSPPQRSQPRARPSSPPQRSQPKARPSRGSSNRGARSSSGRSRGKKD